MPKERTLEATLWANRGSEAVKPKRLRRLDEDEEEGETLRRQETRVRDLEVVDEAVVRSKERPVGAVAEAIVALC